MAVPVEYHGRVTEDYLVNQINGFRHTDSHLNHKTRLQDFDALYRGDLNALSNDVAGLPDIPYVANKLKNATHDLARLASEARGMPIFMRDGEGKTALKRQSLRAAIADTLWHMSGGRRQERKLYLDLVSSGMVALAVFFNDRSDYPVFERLNPRFCFPDVYNGKLSSMVYIETMKVRQAMHVWPNLGLKLDPKRSESSQEVLIVQYYDNEEVCQSVCTTGKNGDVDHAYVVDRWVHGLGCVPVAFRTLDTADDTFHGLFDQLGGPLMVRNKIMKLFVDYMESMVHAPFEAKGVLNADDEPGPLTIYQHDDTREGDSFIRRVQPAAPAGAVFGMMQQLSAEEADESIQPPARVGVVRQSIASGSFVDSTQGTLSSAIFELQDVMSQLRQEANYIAFKIEEKYLDYEKPLFRSVGKTNMYTPSKDLKGFYYHTIQYGASAGLNRSEAASRVLMDLGAGLIDKELARQQIDYIEDATSVQDRIDREQMANVFFQRFSSDPQVPMSLLATAIAEMGEEGEGVLEIVKKLAPQLVEYEKQQQAMQQPEGMMVEGQEPMTEDEMLMEQPSPMDLALPEPPIQQQIVRNPTF